MGGVTEEVLVVGEPGSDSDDGGREQAGRVSRENPTKPNMDFFISAFTITIIFRSAFTNTIMKQAPFRMRLLP